MIGPSSSSMLPLSSIFPWVKPSHGLVDVYGKLQLTVSPLKPRGLLMRSLEEVIEPLTLMTTSESDMDMRGGAETFTIVGFRERRRNCISVMSADPNPNIC